MTSYQENHSLNPHFVRPVQRMKWVVPYACSSMLLLSGCGVDTLTIDYGQTGKILTEEELLAATYIDKEAFKYKVGDQVRLYYVKDGEVYYEVERSFTDQEMKDMIARYQSIVGIFGRLYDVGIGQRFVQGESEDDNKAFFDFEEDNATTISYLKTDVSYRKKQSISTEQPTNESRSTIALASERYQEVEAHLQALSQVTGLSVEELRNNLIGVEVEEIVENVTVEDNQAVEQPTNGQEIESIQVEFAFNVKEGHGLFDLNDYPEVIHLLNAIREVNLDPSEISLINEKVQASMMEVMMIRETGYVIEETTNSVVIHRDGFEESFTVTPDNPTQVVFTQTLKDLISIKTAVATVEKE